MECFCHVKPPASFQWYQTMTFTCIFFNWLQNMVALIISSLLLIRSYHCSSPNLFPLWLSISYTLPCAVLSTFPWPRLNLSMLLFGTLDFLCLFFLIVIELLSRDRLFATPWTAACQAFLYFTISQNLLKLMSIGPLSQWCHQTSYLLLSPSPPALSLFQNQGLFQWVSSSHQVDQVLELQHQSFQWIFRVDFL